MPRSHFYGIYRKVAKSVKQNLSKSLMKYILDTDQNVDAVIYAAVILHCHCESGVRLLENTQILEITLKYIWPPPHHRFF
jgi:formaldehyde-activating enzyme involved in methanogenesis